MDLFEYQGKQYFARFGIPVSPGGVADTGAIRVEGWCGGNTSAGATGGAGG